MKITYFDLIDQSYYFPQEGFNIEDGNLFFNDTSIKYLIDKYQTPFKISFLPKIGDQIKKAKNLFSKAIKQNNYKGTYNYCYCTKSSHFNFVIEETLRHGINLETSSSYDIDIILNLYKKGLINKDKKIIHNGYKTDSYIQKIALLQKEGFTNSFIILDSKKELEKLQKIIKTPIRIGIRMAIDEESQSTYYTSRMGIRASEIIDYYNNDIKPRKNVTLEMLHFFVDTGIKDTMYYWSTFINAMKLYANLKKNCDTLNAINIGGGLPIRNNLGFEYDYKFIINQIVANIKDVCSSEGIDDPDIYTEFGKYTVGESGAIVFEVLDYKQQNDAELWYIINNSLMTTIPDSWSMHEKFILLPINKWDKEYTKVNIGGISCDHSDYYNSEDLNQEIYLPKIDDKDKEPLYIGFFHTGAYQDSISGYGGIKHCLIPSPRHIVIKRNENGQYEDYLFKDEQNAEVMLDILGYND
ncbi:MAG: arginine decarboxylase [Flavobacteriales bacterium]|jgi:arginine decarboxylase|nr:arginine decarboxylase [Flavobacteriales bacterium]MDF1676186.1 arginine decarboxylase [Vicingaceae bacterium]MCW8913400.1 arginine decarboxylase [Flavobacteriales bacterium]MCW8938536.1 arginine decarboxylase [Flavobacteriales bacterium]MCW8939487.1 arginine decarboxylase [Flavobacteriales bacterium]